MRRIRVLTAVVLSLAIFVCWTWSSVCAGTVAESDHSVKVTIIVIPALSFLELEPSLLDQLPHFRRLAYSGAVAALNVRTPGKKTGDSYLSIGAGAAAQNNKGFMAFNRGENRDGATTEQLYERYNGNKADSKEEIRVNALHRNVESSEKDALLVPDIGAIKQLNEGKNTPGLLGGLLERNHIAVSVYGNSDAGDEPRRYAPLMLMNDQGTVRYGNVGKQTLETDPLRPYGIKTDYARMLKWWQASPENGVVLLELGDLVRLYDQRANYDEDQFLLVQARILREMDDLLGHVTERLLANDRLWLFSPEVNKKAASEKRLLAPLFYYEAGISPGLLFSPTTRREGIAAFVDIAPSLLASFSLKPPQEMIGFPLRPVDQDKAWEQLWRENETISRIYDLRPRLLYPFATFEIIVLLIALVAVGLRRKITNTLILPWIRSALWCILVSPIVLLAMGWLAEKEEWVLVFLFLALVAVPSWTLDRLPLFQALTVICAATVGAVVWDGLNGETAIRHSLLGYDPIIGARYYGIGNEFMGVFIGAVLLGGMAFLERLGERKGYGYLTKSNETLHVSRWALLGFALYYAAADVYLAAPVLGANAGGAIAATAAFGVAWMRHRSAASSDKLRRGQLALLLTAPLPAALALLWLLNAALPLAAEQHSHIGRALQLATDGRLDAIVQIALRKLAMNLHLIEVSVWSKVLIASLLAAAVSLLRPGGGFLHARRRYPHLMNGFAAIAVGGILGLAVNDSGIVAAAMMFVYVAVPLLLLNLQDEPAVDGVDGIEGIDGINGIEGVEGSGENATKAAPPIRCSKR